MKLSLGAALVFVTGCASHAAFTIQPSCLESRAEVERAAAAWNAVVKDDHRIVIGHDGWTIECVDPGPGLNGLATFANRTIRIRPDDLGRDESGAPVSTFSVALHEIGHALGMRHTTAGIMAAKGGRPVFAPEDLAECRRAGVCR